MLVSGESVLTNVTDNREKAGTKKYRKHHSSDHITVLQETWRQEFFVLLPYLKVSENDCANTGTHEKSNDLGTAPWMISSPPQSQETRLLKGSRS
jgi:hypothetical protein